MFAHIYTERTELSLEEIVQQAGDALEADYRRYFRVFIRASELIKQPSKIIALNELLIQGRRCNQLIVIVNDIPSQAHHYSSLKQVLHLLVDDAYKNHINVLDKLIKRNTVAF